jgi:hypothetical protein
MAQPALTQPAAAQATADPMQVFYLLGGPGTDADQVFGALMRREAPLAKAGVMLPRPRRLRKALAACGAETDAPEDAPAPLLAHLHVSEATRRLVLFSESLLGGPGQAAKGNLIYPFIAARARQLRDAVAGSAAAFVLTLRNPATLLPALARAARVEDQQAFLAGLEPKALHWLHTLRRLRTHAAEVPVIVWCHEDTPLLWPDLIAMLDGSESAEGEPAADIPGVAAVDSGWMDYLRTLLTERGAAQLGPTLADLPAADRAAQRRAVAAALAAHGRPDMMESDLSATGWTQAEVDEITAGYHADLKAITELDGVTLMSPWRSRV